LFNRKKKMLCLRIIALLTAVMLLSERWQGNAHEYDEMMQDEAVEQQKLTQLEKTIKDQANLMEKLQKSDEDNAQKLKDLEKNNEERFKQLEERIAALQLNLGPKKKIPKTIASVLPDFTPDDIDDDVDRMTKLEIIVSQQNITLNLLSADGNNTREKIGYNEMEIAELRRKVTRADQQIEEFDEITQKLKQSVTSLELNTRTRLDNVSAEAAESKLENEKHFLTLSSSITALNTNFSMHKEEAVEVQKKLINQYDDLHGDVKRFEHQLGNKLKTIDENTDKIALLDAKVSQHDNRFKLLSADIKKTAGAISKIAELQSDLKEVKNKVSRLDDHIDELFANFQECNELYVLMRGPKLEEAAVDDQTNKI